MYLCLVPDVLCLLVEREHGIKTVLQLALASCRCISLDISSETSLVHNVNKVTKVLPSNRFFPQLMTVWSMLQKSSNEEYCLL